MKHITFKTQFILCICILIFSFILSSITKIRIFTNLAWIIYGLAFVINPVWPEIYSNSNPELLKLACRIGGIIVIILGAIIKFGV